jgi:hypothetical protein
MVCSRQDSSSAEDSGSGPKGQLLCLVLRPHSGAIRREVRARYVGLQVRTCQFVVSLQLHKVNKLISQDYHARKLEFKRKRVRFLKKNLIFCLMC